MGTPSRRAGAGPGQASAFGQDEFVQLPRRTVVLTMAGVMLAMFLASLDQTVVSTATPRIIADLGGFDRFTWITTAYLVASTTMVPIVGKLTDIYGRKRFFIGGIALFIVGSVLAGLSQTMDQLIAFRAIQGAGGGVIMANSFIAIADLFPPKERGKYQGMIAGVFGLSSVIGPTLGGFITDNISWHWVFLVNVPISVPVIALFMRYFPETRRRTREAGARLDYAGMGVLVLAVVPLLIGLSVGGVQYDWVSPGVIGALAFGSAMSIVFVFIESRAVDPIMPLEIYRNRMVLVSLIAIFLTGFGMFGAIIFIPLFFQGVLGASATSSGSFLTPMMLGVVFGAALSGQLLSRTGGRYRVQALVGVSIMGAGIYLISQMTEATGFGRAVVNIVIMGFGLGATFPTYTLAVQNSVPFSVMGVATSATQFFRSVGGLLGLAIMGAIMADRFSSRLSDAVPDSLAQVIGVGRMEGMQSNPQSLVNPDALARLRSEIEASSPQGAAAVDQLLAIMKSSLSQAIGDVFLISVAVVALAFLVTIFLRKSGVDSHGESLVDPIEADRD